MAIKARSVMVQMKEKYMLNLLCLGSIYQKCKKKRKFILKIVLLVFITCSCGLFFSMEDIY